ncbi:hypothetical protein JHK82_018573 [Glycine max]|nr:hypothetical protein JHK82_018573 [Glycine max]
MEKSRHRNMFFLLFHHFALLLLCRRQHLRLTRTTNSLLSHHSGSFEWAEGLVAVLHEQAKLILKAKHGIDDSDELVQGVEEGSRIGSVGPDCVVGGEIFCNQPLNMKNIVVVGFDMDYTLAQYIPKTFESLVYQHTFEKLVYDLDYPREMDRHKYVKVAYHGFKELSKEEKVGTYENTLLVDFEDKNLGRIQEHVDYAHLYKDVQNAVDLCHRDGTLKQKVFVDPKREADEIYKICGVIGNPTFESWAGGLELARDINYQFPQLVGVHHSALISSPSDDAINLITISLLALVGVLRPFV